MGAAVGTPETQPETPPATPSAAMAAQAPPKHQGSAVVPPGAASSDTGSQSDSAWQAAVAGSRILRAAEELDKQGQHATAFEQYQSGLEIVLPALSSEW